MRFLIIAAAALLGACAGNQTADESAAIADGRAIAEAQCASCHTIGEFGDSPLPDAPPFRTILARYNEEALETDLIEGVRVAHPMPEFQFNPQGADALIAYLRSIQVAEPADPGAPATTG